MAPFRTAKYAALVAMLPALSASAASALTAEEVWADWQRLAKDGGVEITAIARREGDRLVLTNIAIPVGPPGDMADIKIGRVELQDRPDGTVAVLLPDSFPVTIDTRNDDSPGPDLVELAASAPGFAMTIAGIGDTAAFDISAPSLALSLERVVPAVGVEEKFDLNLAIADFVLQHKMDLTQPTESFASTLRLGTLHSDVLFEEDGQEEKVDLSIDVSKLAWTLDGALPGALREQAGVASPTDGPLSPEALTALLAEISLNGELSYDIFEVKGDVDQNDEQMTIDGRSASGQAIVKFDGKLVSYDAAVGETLVAIKVNAPENVDIKLGLASALVQGKADYFGAIQTTALNLRLGPLHSDILINPDGSENERGNVSIGVANVSGAIDFALPSSLYEQLLNDASTVENPLPAVIKALSDGLLIRYEFAYDDFTMKGDVDQNGEQFNADLSSASGKAIAKLDAQSVSYEVSLGKTLAAAKGDLPDMEFSDFTISVADYGYGFSFGIGDLTKPQDARLHARLSELAISPEFWKNVDPALEALGLGKEPLSFGFDVSASYSADPEMLDPNWTPKPNEPPPFDIVNFAINELMFSGLGVRFGGDGALTFDETDLVTFKGFPVPEGKLSFQATGVNALIDRIVAAGLVQPDELTAFRMGLMFVAKAGEAADSLVSQIEFRDKSFYLNGMKMR